MKNALKVGSVAQIGIYLHWTFLVMMSGLFAFYMARSDSPASGFVSFGLLAAIFFCVLLHELGHALTARHFHVPTRDITMYPFGGVARLQRLPSEPMKEFWIAVAGPAVNLVIALLLAVFVTATGGSLSPRILMEPERDFAANLMWMNLVLVGFNMLPAFPMDGGRVLRALLASRMDYARATEIAAGVGQFMAIVFGFLGVINFNPVLLFIALFVYIGAGQESQATVMRTLTQGVSVRQAMMTRFRVLSPEDPLSVAIDELLSGTEQDFLVVRNAEPVGILTRKDMLRALSEHGRDVPIGAVVQPSTLVVEDTDMLEEAFSAMEEAGSSVVPVLRERRIVGLLTLENVGELMMVSSALRKAGGRVAGQSPLS